MANSYIPQLKVDEEFMLLEKHMLSNDIPSIHIKCYNIFHSPSGLEQRFPINQFQTHKKFAIIL